MSDTTNATSTLALADIDVDGALREATDRLPTRGQFLRRGGRAATVAILAAGLLPEAAQARASKRDQAKAAADDNAILNFALTLEYLQAAFYTQAERVGSLHGALAEQARVVGSHERAHVKAFQKTLGRAAVKSPSFNFRGSTDNPKSFRATAVAFEDLAVGAYKEQLPKISSDAYLAAAISIHSVEARHAAWIRYLAGIVPAEHAFDGSLPDHQTVQIVDSTHFVNLQAPRTSARHAPAFTG
jgi:Ferritin-like domain